MIQYQYKELIVEVLDEPNNEMDSVDHPFKYSKHYFTEDSKKYRSYKHGIRIYKGEQIVDSCIVAATGGRTGVSQNSTLLDEDQLLICCCDTLFCLSLPDLELKWLTQADPATCFAVFKLQDGYVVHGEMLVVKLKNDGSIQWEFSSPDIFVSIDGKKEFEFENDGILLTNFSGNKFKIDFNGNLIWTDYK